jgi:hypothetical protein
MNGNLSSSKWNNLKTMLKQHNDIIIYFNYNDYMMWSADISIKQCIVLQL